MRILIVSTFFPPLNSIASLRPYSWAKYWTEKGHDVTILTTKKGENPGVDLQVKNNGFTVLEVEIPYFISRLKKSYNDKKAPPLWKKGLLRAFDAFREKTGALNGCRMPDITHLWIKPAIQKTSVERPFELCVSTAGPYTTHLVAHALKKRGLAKRWIADYRDPWSDSYLFKGVFPFNIYERYLENKILQDADAITTVAASFQDLFIKRFRKDKVHLIENGFDASDGSSLNPDPIFPDDGKFRIVHTGKIWLGKRDPTLLFEAIRTLQNEHVEVLFVGQHTANLVELIQKYKVEAHVKYAGFVSRDDALRMQRDAHALLFLPWCESDPKVEGPVTGKIYEYLFSKTPIISLGGMGDPAVELILQAKAGSVFHDVTTLANFLGEKLKGIKKEKIALDSHFLSRYERSFLADKMLSILDSDGV